MATDKTPQTGASFGIGGGTPIANKAPGGAAPLPPEEQPKSEPIKKPVAEAHPPITDNFMARNRYVGGTDTYLNEFGGLDIGVGGPLGTIYKATEIHIHTAMTIKVSS